MLGRNITWLVCIILSLNISSAGSERFVGGEASSEDAIYEQSLSAFIKEIDNTYPFFDLKGIRDDWDMCKGQLLEKVRRCDSNRQFYSLLHEARICLRDSHIGFGNLKGEYPQPPARYYPGICFFPAAEGQVVIMSSVPEYEKKLKPGTIVAKIDGEKARDYLERDAEKSWKAGGYFSSPQRARLYSYRIPLKGDENAEHRITIIKNGKTEEINVVNKWKAVGWPHTYAMPKRLQRHGNCYYTKLKADYGYIYLRRIRSELVEAIDKALGSFENIRGLIIDLRGNGGGGYGREVFARFDKKKGPSKNAPLFYRGDIAVLIDAGTISAGETFARDLVYAAEAHLMGSRTAGSSSAKRAWQLPGDLGTVTLPTRSRWGFKGKHIEYNGIEPHEEVLVVPEELQSGINSGIKRAQEYLEKKWASRSEADRKLPLIVRQKLDTGAVKKSTARRTFDISGTVFEPVSDAWFDSFFDKLADSNSSEELNKTLRNMQYPRKPAADVVVVASSGSFSDETVTNSLGVYHFADLPTNPYTVSAKIVKNGVPSFDHKAITLDSNRIVNLNLETRAIVKGRVVDIHGKPVAGVRITGTKAPFTVPEGSGPWHPESVQGVSDRNGSYELSGLKPTFLYPAAAYLLTGWTKLDGFYVDMTVAGGKDETLRVPLVTEKQLNRPRRGDSMG
ncbi:MAG: S41 family peptidase [Planctomycetota bacterium]